MQSSGCCLNFPGVINIWKMMNFKIMHANNSTNFGTLIIFSFLAFLNDLFTIFPTPKFPYLLYCSICTQFLMFFIKNFKELIDFNYHTVRCYNFFDSFLHLFLIFYKFNHQMKDIGHYITSKFLSIRLLLVSCVFWN